MSKTLTVSIALMSVRVTGKADKHYTTAVYSNLQKCPWETSRDKSIKWQLKHLTITKYVIV